MVISQCSTPLHAGLIYAMDRVAGTIETIAFDGTRSVYATGFSTLANAAFDSNGNLFVVDQQAGEVHKFTSDGSRTVFASNLGQPFGIAIAVNGNVFVSDVSASDSKIHLITPNGSQSVFATGFLFAAGLALDIEQNLFVADFNRITKITPDGASTLFSGAPEGAINLAFSLAEELFLTTDQQNIFRYSSSGISSVFGDVPGRSGGIVFDDDGALYVTDRGPMGIGQTSIYRFSPAGERSLYVSGLNDIQGLTYGPRVAIPEPSSLTLLIFIAASTLYSYRRPRLGQKHIVRIVRNT